MTLLAALSVWLALAAVIWIVAGHNDRRIARIRRELALEAEVAALMADARAPCPWPQNIEAARGPYRIAVHVAAAPEMQGGGAAAVGTQLHNQVSFPVLLPGGDGAL